mgnify:FL=1|jgi:uncharacterized protein YacL
MSQKNEEKHQVYGIPRNLKSAGKIADVIEVTSLVQGIIIALILMGICLKVLNLPFRYTIIIMAVAVFMTALPYGKNNDTFCKYIYLLLRTFFVRKTYRRYVRHRSSEQKKTVKQRLMREKTVKEDDDFLWEGDWSEDSEEEKR